MIRTAAEAVARFDARFTPPVFVAGDHPYNNSGRLSGGCRDGARIREEIYNLMQHDGVDDETCREAWEAVNARIDAWHASNAHHHYNPGYKKPQYIWA